MKNLDPRVQEDILDLTYITTNHIYQLYPFGKAEATKLFKEIESELISQGIPLIPGRPATVPLSRVLKKYPLDEKKIRNAAKRKREESKHGN